MNANKLAELMTAAINDNIFTKDQFLTYEYHADIWLEIYQLCTLIVNKKYHSISNITRLTGYEKNDYINDLACHLVKQYEKLVTDVNNNRDSFNYYGYFDTCFSNYTRDLLKKEKKPVVVADNKLKNKLRPVTVKDEYGNDKKLYYTFTSSSTPLSDETASATIEDTLVSNELNPEEKYLLKEALIETPEKLYKIFKKVAKHKNKLSLLSVINLINQLEEEGNLNEIYNRLYSAGQLSDTGVMTLHNREVKKFIKKHHIPDDKSYYMSGRHNYTLNSANINPRKIADDMDRAKNIAKEDIAKLYHIDLHKKEQKAKKKINE